jgi:hypothetical protein
MRHIAKILVVALSASGCLYEREVVRQRPISPPPPPPSTSDDSASRYDTHAYADSAPERDVVDTEVFYERLSPYGYWESVAPYGRVWVPTVGYGWRPYYFGRWVLTDWGWTFISDDPWGWAAYHYGRWNWGVGVGWYWIPGRVWAPAWVSWRYGAGYVGWCPLGPPGVVFGYSHPAWVAVREQHFTRPIAAVAIPTRATAGIVTQTAPLAGPHATAARMGEFGPPVARVQAATGEAIRPQPVARVLGRPQQSPQTGPRVIPEAGPRARDPMRTPAPRVGAGSDNGRPAPHVNPAPRPIPRSGGGDVQRPAPREHEGMGRPQVPRASGGGGWHPAPAPAPAARPSGGAPHASGDKSRK